MIQNALLIVGDDPRLSPRPAEAVRLAAGIVPWQKVRFTVYLHGPAVLALSAATDALVDEDNYRRYWPLLAEHQQTVCVQRDQPLLSQIGEPALPFRAIGTEELASLAASADAVLRF